MADSLMKTQADLAAGHLPPPIVAWPVSQRRFHRLIRHWRALNVWLSLWSAEGKMIDYDDETPGPIGDALRAGDNAFSEALAAYARAVVSEDVSADRSPSSGRKNLGPWQGDLGMIASPVRARRRCTGVVLGIFATTKQPGEALARLCDENGFDPARMAQFLDRAGTVPDEMVPNLAGLLSLTVDQAHEKDVGDDEIAILTSNLDNSYEELHLIYEISRQMSLPQKPVEMLERVGREMLDVSRAACVAFLLDREAFANGSVDGTSLRVHPESPVASPSRRCIHGQDARSTEVLGRTLSPFLPGEEKQRERLAPALADDRPISTLEDRAVQVGPGAPRLEDLQRLADSLSLDAEISGGYLLLNMATRRPELRWASSWLKHLVVLPLCQDGRRFGILYAINCVDERDFTSVDVQLLRAVADRVTAALQNQHLYDDLTQLLMGLVHALVNSVDAKDTYTFGHSERVAYLSRALAQAMGMSPIEYERVHLAGLLHDVGKIGVPDATLCKPGKLTVEEFDALKKHPEIGERILSNIVQIRDLLPGVLYHHERMDGRGYPHGLAGRQIPLLGRIICLADAFDAMTTNRTYRAALPVALAIAEIRRCSGNQFDPALAEIFLSIDPHRLYKEAHACTKGHADFGRIGAFSVALSGPALPRAYSSEGEVGGAVTGGSRSG